MVDSIKIICVKILFKDNEGIRDVSTYDFSRDLKDRTVILPGESDKVRYQRNYKEEPARKLAQSVSNSF